MHPYWNKIWSHSSFHTKHQYPLVCLLIFFLISDFVIWIINLKYLSPFYNIILDHTWQALMLTISLPLTVTMILELIWRFFPPALLVATQV